MTRPWAWAALAALTVVVAMACGSTPGDEAQLARVSSALSVCEEEVPADRFIDGFPAYAQCEGSESEAIYSNNGIDTATSAMGDDWVRTQFSGGYQCTELVNRYFTFKWDIEWLPRGNAGTWCDEEPPEDSGLVLTQVPVHGDAIVLAPGSCGADGTTGHVALVDEYDAERDRISAVQQNIASRGRYELSCAACFVHVVANVGASEPEPSTMPTASASAPPEEPQEPEGAGGAPPSASSMTQRPAPMEMPPAASTTSELATPSAEPSSTAPAQNPSTAPTAESQQVNGAGGASPGAPAPATQTPVVGNPPPNSTSNPGAVPTNTPSATGPAAMAAQSMPMDSSAPEAGCAVRPAPAGRGRAWILPVLLGLVISRGRATRRSGGARRVQDVAHFAQQ